MSVMDTDSFVGPLGLHVTVTRLTPCADLTVDALFFKNSRDKFL